MDNPETLATLGTQDTGQINVRENRHGIQEWTIQRHWQHWVHRMKTSKNKQKNIETTHKIQTPKNISNENPIKTVGVREG